MPETNTVVLGTKEDLEEQQMTVGKYNLIKYAALPKNVKDLLKASEGTKSYESGMSEVRKIASQQFRDDIRYVKEMGAKSPDSIITSSE